MRYPHGQDYEWFGVDKQGQIARFTSGGLGWIPTAVLDHEEIVGPAQSEVRGLPRRCAALLMVAVPKPDDFIRTAEAGLFVYDCDDISRSSGRYKLAAAPTVPVLKALVSPTLQLAADLVVLSEITFGEVAAIAVEQFMDSVSPID